MCTRNLSFNFVITDLVIGTSLSSISHTQISYQLKLINLSTLHPIRSSCLQVHEVEVSECGKIYKFFSLLLPCFLFENIHPFRTEM